MTEQDPLGNTLEEQIELRRREIFTQTLSMSVGELTAMYADGDLIIQPEFQRLFRWDNEQKSKLVESILLGIPIPTVFVSTTSDGRWEVIDGLQRISTLLQLQGVLRSVSGLSVEPLILDATRYLPALEGKVWDAPPSLGIGLGSIEKRDIRRARIDIQIIKRESSTRAKYDLFQRLNSFGSPLTPQEIRGALLASVNPEFLHWTTSLVKYPVFSDCMPLSDRQMREQYDFELVLRFLVLHSRANVRARELRGFSSFLDDESISLAESFPRNHKELQRTFQLTFQKIFFEIGEDAFRRWDSARERFSGAFLNSSFEVIALGLGYHIAQGRIPEIPVNEAVRRLWEDRLIPQNFSTGRSTEDRISTLLPIGRALFSI
ncbi:DUF262 domain-containing protein [Gordonia sp. DT218]|uniref:DUF262 domain-containing protein n=1 Tax=Gordonia sp. DT218 TaxID=3416659 RepID=UPI003CE966FF